MKKRSLLIIFAAVLILNSCKKINNSDNDMTAAAEGGSFRDKRAGNGNEDRR